MQFEFEFDNVRISKFLTDSISKFVECFKRLFINYSFVRKKHVPCYVICVTINPEAEIARVGGHYAVQGPRSFKVTNFGPNRKPICDFLSVIDAISRQVVAGYWSNLRF